MFDGANKGTVSNAYSATVDLTPPTVVNDTAIAKEQGGDNNATAGINPTGDVLLNDTAGANDSLTVKSVTGAGSATTVAASGSTDITGSYGILTIAANGSYTYTVDQNNPTVQALKASSTGLTEVFTYTAKDVAGLTATATLTITVNGADDNATISGTATGAVTEDASTTTATGTLTVTDVDSGDNVLQTPASLTGTYGSFALNTSTGVWTYTLDNTKTTTQALTAGQQVIDTLTVTSQDGTATQNVVVTITGANDTASISGTATGSITEDASPNNASGTLTVTDVDTGQAVFQTPSSLVGSYGTFTFNASTGAWTYTLDNTKPAVQALPAGSTLTDTLTVTSQDGTASRGIAVTITGANDAASITGTATGAITEDASPNTASGTLTATDVDTGQAVFQTPSSLVGSYGTFTFNASTGAWTYTLDNSKAAVQALPAGSTLTDTLTVTSQDGTATQNVVVTITGANDAAAISGTTMGAVTEDASTTTATGTLTVTDVDTGQALLQTPSSLSGIYGSFTLNTSTGAWTYTLDNTKVQALTADQQVTDTLVVKSSDGSATQNVVVTVTGANDTASISGTVTGAVTEDASTATATGTLTVTDVDTGQALLQTPGSLSGTYGSFALNTATGVWTYTLDNTKAVTQALAQGETKTDKLTVLSQDGSVTQDVTVTITGVNDVATFTGDTNKAVTEINSAQTVTGQLNVADVDSASTVTAQTNVAGSAGLGQFSITSSGAWTYVMNNAQNQLKPTDSITDSLTVTTADGTTQVISVVITGSNDAPVLTTSSVLSYTEAEVSTAINTVVTVTDVDNTTQVSAKVAITGGYVAAQDLLSFVANSASMGNITGSYSAGVMSLSSAGGTATLAQWQAALQAVKYSNTSANPDTSTRTVSYSINDGTVDSAVLTSTINLVSVNNAPVNTVPGTTQTTAEDTAKVITGLSIADTDAGTGNMTVTLAVDHGTISVAAGTGVTLTTNGTGSVQLLGTLSAINTLLATTNAVTYTPTLNYNGSDTLTVTTSDNGNTGSGNVLTDQDTVALSVTAVNDPPVVTGNVSLSTLEDNAITFKVADQIASKVTDADGTAFKGIVIVQNTSTNGTWAYSTDGNTWTDFPTSLNVIEWTKVMYLDASAYLRFTPVNNANGTNLGNLNFRAVDDTFLASPVSGTLCNANNKIGDSISNSPGFLTVSVTAVNDAPVVTPGATAAAYTENAVAVVINSALTVSDVDSANLTGATVSIGSGFTTGDVLAFTNANGITGSYNSSTGVLTLTGTATVANYQTGLRSITFSSTSEAPTAISATRTINWQVDDGQTDNHASNVGTSTINITAINDAPTGTSSTLTVLEDGSKTFVATDFGFNDVDGNALSAVIITTLPTVGTLKLNGTAVTLNQSIPVASLGSLVYAPVANASGTSYATIGFKVKDDGGTANSGVDTSTTANTLTINVTTVNDPPVLATASTLAYTENGPAAVINSVIVPTDVDNTTFARARVSITSGFESGKDVLSFTNASMGNIVGSYDAATGVMTLTSAGATATLANWQAALRAVKFNSTTDNPVAPRTVSYVLNDGSADSNVITSTINFTAVNDAPVNTVPTAQSAGVGTVTAITGLSIADADANTGSMTVTLSLPTGVGVINVSGGTAAIASGNGTNSVVLTGPVAAINSTLASGVTYTLASGAPASTTLTMLTSDNGNTGGAALTDTDTVTIAVQSIVISNVQVTQATTGPVSDPLTTAATGAQVTALSTSLFDITASGMAINGGTSKVQLYSSFPGTSTTGSAGSLALDYDAIGGSTDPADTFVFKLKTGTMTGTLSMYVGYLNYAKTVTFWDVNGAQVGASQALAATGQASALKSFTIPTVGNPVTTFKITGAPDTFWIDDISYTGDIVSTTTINNALTTSTGNSTTVTPTTINGTLALALAANEVVEVFRNGVSIGNATVTGTTWKIVDSSLNTVQTDLYEARVKNTSTSAMVTDSNDYVINPLTLAITNAAADAALSDSFATSTSTADVTSVSTTLWDISSTENVRWASAATGTNWTPTGSVLLVHASKSLGSGNAVDSFRLKGGATFSGITFTTGYADAVSAPNTPVDVRFYDASNVLLSTQQFTFSGKTLYSPFNFTSTAFAGQASYFTLTTAYNNAFAIDDLSYTTTSGSTSFTIASGGTMVDTTPVLNGTIPRALAAGETVDIFLDGATTAIGSATIAIDATSWTWAQPTALTAATHTYVAKIKSSGAYIGTSNTFSVVVAATPLVLDLNGDGVQTVSAEQGVEFDLLATGTKQTVGWVDKHDGLLAMDLNGDGQINSGAELFGDHTQLADGSLAKDGWAALAAQDSNADGVIDTMDANFDKLRVWVDANGDGITDAGELQTLDEVHIASINLQADTRSVQQNGNVVQMFSTYTTTDGATHEVADVGLKVQAADAGFFTLRNGDSLDLSALGTSTLVDRIDMSADTAANTVKLTLSDVLGLHATNGQHKLTLTGDANDTANVNLNEWLNTGNTVTDHGHSYTVYNGATDSSAQLLIDQHMLMANHG